MKAKVKDCYTIFVFPDDRLIQVTPKEEFKKALGQNAFNKAKILNGEKPVDSLNSDGTQYIKIERDVTCTTIGGLTVVFE